MEIPSFLGCCLYEGLDERDADILGELKWCGPKRFEHGEWHTIAQVPKEPADGDGQPCEIQECRMPCRFFRLVVIESADSTGSPKPGYKISTGSGDEMGRLIVALAKAVSGGMIGLDTDEKGSVNAC